MNETLLLVLRDRVANHFYERPEVVDAVARMMIADRSVGFAVHRSG